MLVMNTWARIIDGDIIQFLIAITYKPKYNVRAKVNISLGESIKDHYKIK